MGYLPDGERDIYRGGKDKNRSIMTGDRIHLFLTAVKAKALILQSITISKWVRKHCSQKHIMHHTKVFDQQCIRLLFENVTLLITNLPAFTKELLSPVLIKSCSISEFCPAICLIVWLKYQSKYQVNNGPIHKDTAKTMYENLPLIS